MTRQPGFTEVAYLPQGKNERFTISESARVEVLRQLAGLNKQHSDAQDAEPVVVEEEFEEGLFALPAEQERGVRVAKVVSHQDCASADLILDAVYEGGQTKNARSDAISKVMPGSGNQGGFRAPELATTRISSFSTRAARTGIGPTTSI